MPICRFYKLEWDSGFADQPHDQSQVVENMSRGPGEFRQFIMDQAHEVADTKWPCWCGEGKDPLKDGIVEVDSLIKASLVSGDP